MSPVLVSQEGSRDLAVVARVNKYYRNDIVLYLDPNTGKEAFGRLVKVNSAEDMSNMRGKLPSGHCWIENDNPRSGAPDSGSFGAIPLGLLRGCVFGTVYPFDRLKLLVS